MRILPRHKISIIEPGQKAVFGLFPQIEPEVSTFYGERLVAPESLKDTEMKVIIGFETCIGQLQQGYSPRKCTEEGNGWNKVAIKSVVSLLEE